MQIRKIELADLETRVAWMNNPQIYSTMHFQIPVLIENTIKWYENNKTREDRFDATFLEEGKVVGFGGFTAIDTEKLMAELYIFVNPESHKSGIGTRATQMLCQYGFEVLKLRKIYLYTNENNIPAIHVYEKCGFVLEGRHRKEAVNPQGGYYDRMYYGLFKDELNG